MRKKYSVPDMVQIYFLQEDIMQASEPGTGDVEITTGDDPNLDIEPVD